MTIWDNTHDLIQLIEMCIYLPINILLCIPAIAVYFGREAYLLFHLITGFKLVPKGQRIDRDTIRHRGALYLFLHVYVIYALWNVMVTICMIIRPLVNDFVFNQIIQRAAYNYNLQWYFTLVATFILVWSRAASVWFQERSTILRAITNQYLLIGVLCLQLLVAFVMHTTYVTVIPMHRGGVMEYDTYMVFSVIITVLTFTILASMVLLVITFGTVIIIIVTRSNNTLTREWREKGQKVPKYLMNRIVLQRWTIGKLFFVMGALLLALFGKTCGHIMFTLQANESLREVLPPWLIENVLRGPPDWLVLASMAVVFWPWKMPPFLISMLTAACAIDAENMPAMFQPIEFVRDMMPSPKQTDNKDGGDEKGAEAELEEGEEDKAKEDPLEEVTV